jgi:hypothetical protein
MKLGSFRHTSFKGVHEFLKVHFRPAYQTHQNRTSEFHMQPLPHFINGTHLTTQRPPVLCNFNNVNILQL